MTCTTIPKQSPDSLKRLPLDAFGVQYLQTAHEIFGVHKTTVRRWLTGEQTPSQGVLRLLHVLAYGLEYLPSAGPAWRGWCFRRGNLFDASTNPGDHSRGSIRTWFWLSQELQGCRKFEARLGTDIEQSPNILPFPSSSESSASLLTRELHRKLAEIREKPC